MGARGRYQHGQRQDVGLRPRRTVNVIGRVALEGLVGRLKDGPHDSANLLLEERQRVEDLERLVVELCRVTRGSVLASPSLKNQIRSPTKLFRIVISSAGPMIPSILGSSSVPSSDVTS